MRFDGSGIHIKLTQTHSNADTHTHTHTNIFSHDNVTINNIDHFTHWIHIQNNYRNVTNSSTHNKSH